jgi:hypothetical protein
MEFVKEYSSLISDAENLKKILDKRNHWLIIASIRVSINGILAGVGGVLNNFPDFQSDRSDQIGETAITAEMGVCVGSDGSEVSRAPCTNPRLSPSLHWSPPKPSLAFLLLFAIAT